MIIGGQEFNHTCSDCELKNDIANFGQGSICIRCPIFNCAGEEPLLQPDDYRKDWAKQWKIWFDNGGICRVDD